MTRIKPRRDDHIVNDIEDVRRSNNAAWMDIVRLALRVAPDEAKDILRRINHNDRVIAALMQELT